MLLIAEGILRSLYFLVANRAQDAVNTIRGDIDEKVKNYSRSMRPR